MSESEVENPAQLSSEDELLLLAKQDLQEAVSLSFRHVRMLAEGTANGDMEKAFVRAMVVAYASPWSWKPSITADIESLPDCLTDSELVIHEALLTLRKKLFAHSDRKHAKPSLRDDDGLPPMFSRVELLFSVNHQLALWRNARKLRDAASEILHSRHAVFPASHRLVDKQPDWITDDEAAQIANQIDDDQVTGFVLNGWRDIDTVTLAELGDRLEIPDEAIEALSDDEVRLAHGFPAPARPQRPDDDVLRWKVGDVRDWRFRYGLAQQFGELLESARQRDADADEHH